MSLREALNKVSEERDRIERKHDDVPGQKLWIQKLTGTERDEWESLVDKQTTKDGNFINFGLVRAKLIQLSLTEEDGAPAYKEEELAKINALPGTLREFLWEESSDFNGLSAQAKEARLKNSDGEAGNGSDTASPTSSETPQFGNYLNP